MEATGRAVCEYATALQVSIGAEDVLEQIRTASGIRFSDNMQQFVMIDKPFTRAERDEITTEVKEKLEVKKLMKETGGDRGKHGTPGADASGSSIPLCKQWGDRCYSYQKGIRCTHGLQSAPASSRRQTPVWHQWWPIQQTKEV